MSFEIIAWFVGSWIVGGLVYNFFGIQISIMKRCAMKLYNMIRNDTEYWYSGGCYKYIKKVIRNNTIIILVISILVLAFLPLIGIAGFFVGYFVKLLFSSPATGVNDQNLQECISIFLRFAKPGMEDEMREGLEWVAHRLKTESLFKHI